MAVSGRITYEFSDFRLIPEENLLLRNGESVGLPPKAFSTLVLLLENHGHLVRKEELVEKIWADVYVDEAAVSRCVWTIRNALGEDSKSQRFIQTVPKRGYKFVAEVSVLSEADRSITDGNPSIASNSNAGEPQRRDFVRNRPQFAASAVLLLAVGFFAAYIWYPWTTTSSEGVPVTIAVLPFRPVNSPNRDALYELGMTETLINKLSTVEKLQVRSLGSVQRYVNTYTDASKAGKEQRVEYVLASNYQSVEGRIRVTAQLINVSTGKTVEAFDFLKEAPDVFTAQESVAVELRDRLAARFGDRSVNVLTKRGTNNEEAYRYYLLAQNFNELRGPENGRKALEQINQAVALDPNFARAWATKAYIHRYMGYGAAAIEHSVRSMEAVEKALALDPSLSEAHSTLCFNKFRFEYDFDAAERACRRAIELDQNSPLAHKLYGNFLYTRGRFDEAIAEIEKAIDLQPVSFDNQQTYALALYFARKFSESEIQWKQLVPLNPDHKLIYAQLVRTLVQQGKEPEALEHIIKLLTLENADEVTIKRFRAAFAGSGWRGVTLERIKLIGSRENLATFELARLYASIDDTDNAFKYLERAHRERSNMMAVVEVDPELDSLRADARYTELLRRLNEKYRP